MQGTQVRSLVREDSTCCRATKPTHHTYEALALESVLCNKRRHRKEKPAHHNQRVALSLPQLEKAHKSTKEHERPSTAKKKVSKKEVTNT